MLTTALKARRVDAQQKVVDTLTAKVEAHKTGLADSQQSLKLAVAELAYRKGAPTFDPEVSKVVEVVAKPVVEAKVPEASSDEPSF